MWRSDTVKARVEKLGPGIVYAKENGVLEAGTFDDDFFSGHDLLIIEGNCVLDIAIISRLKRYRQKNVIVVNEAHNPDEFSRMVTIKGNDVTSIGNSKSVEFPWAEFAGVVKLSSELIGLLRSATRYPRSLFDVIEDISKDCSLKALMYNDLVYGKLNGGYSEELTGGSYSKLNYRLVVKKESSNEGRNKLINEIKWLLSLPAELKPYFSEILEYDITSEKVFYNVPYYGSRNLREHILDGHLDADGACKFIEKLLDWMFKNVYSRRIGPAPDGWVMEKHINRVLNRLPECSGKSPELGRAIDAEKIIINNREYRNVREIYTSFSKMNGLLELLRPKELVMVHGDLHFQNILLTNDTDTGFIMVDPRGELSGSDVYYDLGKLWHSFHAKYDFIHSDQFKLNLKWKNGIPIANFEITNALVSDIYEEIHQKFRKIIMKYDFIRNDPNWEMKVLFAEASHLCSVSTFHIGKKGNSDRPIMLYLIGVQLANEFFDRFIKNLRECAGSR